MLGIRIKKLRKLRDLKQYELAEKVGVNQQSISDYERNGIENAKAKTIRELSVALDTSPEYLLGLSDISDSNAIEFSDEDFVKIPIYGSIPAGKPIEALEVDYGYVDILASRLKGDKQFIGLKVKGDSMYPYYMSGDIVIIELTPDAKSGDDVVAYIGYDHEATLKRYHKKEDHIELEPMNRYYEVQKFYEGDKPVRILGVVRELRREVS